MRRNARWLAGALAALALALAIAWLLFVPAADRLAHHDIGSAKGALLLTARDEARGRLLTLGAGLLATGALLFTGRNFILSREGQVTDRYTKALTQLGDDKLDVRLGGIYALERIARDSRKDHSTVIEVLAAFVREHSPGRPDGTEPATDLQSPHADVQASLTVIGRRTTRNRDIQRINLASANLAHAELGPNLVWANLSEAVLTGANIAAANLVMANLRSADLAEVWAMGAALRGRGPLGCEPFPCHSRFCGPRGSQPQGRQPQQRASQ